MSVTEITSTTQYNDFIRAGGPGIIKFYYTWCGHCQEAAPVFAGYSASNRGIRFGAVDIDQHGDIAGSLGIHTAPSFVSYRNGGMVDKQQGISHVPAMLSALGGR